MEHPDITTVRNYGCTEKEPQLLLLDELGNEIYEGDEVLDLDTMLFSVFDLSRDAIEILEMLGAVRRTI